MQSFDSSVLTLYDNFLSAVQKYGTHDILGYHATLGDLPFLGVRRMENGEAKEYVYESYKEVSVKVSGLAYSSQSGFCSLTVFFRAGLSSFGLESTAKIGIFAINRPEWVPIHVLNKDFSFFSFS